MTQTTAMQQPLLETMQPCIRTDNHSHQELTSARDSLSSPFLPDPTEKLKLDALVERFEMQGTQPSNSQTLEEELITCIHQHSAEFKSNADHLAWIRRQVEDGDFWACAINDMPTTASKLPHILVSKIIHGNGIPAIIRGVVWQALCQTSSETMSIYDRLHTTPSPYENIIRRMHSDDDVAMQRLLHAYSVYQPDIGYNESLASLTKPLLMTMSEKEAFSVLIRLMESYDIQRMMTLNMEGLELRLHQFAMLLDQQCPELANHLANHDVDPTMYASQWYLSLFSNVLPTDLVLRIYDLVFAFGAVETTTRVAIALMKKNAKHLMALDDFESLLRHLKHHLLPITVDDVVALSNEITPAKLNAIAHARQQQFANELANTTLPILQARMFGAPVSQQQVQALSSALQQLHHEHTQLVQVVESARAVDHTTSWLKQRNAELESRATRYEQKLAAAAENEDALTDDEDEELRELLTLKMANFDLGEKCHDMEAQYHTLLHSVHESEQEHATLLAKIDELQATVDHMRQEKEHLVEEQREILDEKTVTEQQMQQAKQSSSASQMDKLALVKQVANLEKQVEKLEQEKRDYTMPRGSFAEEVFAAHETLFGEKTDPAALDADNTSDDEYQQRYAESEQRCRELEKMLAEAKLKLGEHERQQKRRSSKRYSNGVPMSPSLYYDSSRPSTDSMASYGSKRSSIYSRIWSTIGSTAATSPASSVACKSPVLTSARPIDLVEEPEEII